MNIITERNKTNRMRQKKKQEYDEVMQLSAYTPMVLSDRQMPNQKDLDKILQENADLKIENASLRAKIQTMESAKKQAVYTDGIGE